MLWTVSCKPYLKRFDELLHNMCKSFSTPLSYTDSTYSWRHERTLDFAALDILTNLHWRSLKKLEIYEHNSSGPYRVFFHVPSVTSIVAHLFYRTLETQNLGRMTY